MPTPAPQPVPEGMTTITPHLWFGGSCAAAIELYQRALGASVRGDVIPTPDGSGVWHAMLTIGDSNIMLADVEPGHTEAPPGETTSVSFWLYVDDCDAWFARAVNAGFDVVAPLEDHFWGDRSGTVRDPFGHVWAFATHKWIFTEEEMAAAMAG